MDPLTGQAALGIKTIFLPLKSFTHLALAAVNVQTG